MSNEFEKVAVAEVINRMTSTKESLRILDEAGLASLYLVNKNATITEFVIEKRSLTLKMLKSKPSNSSHYRLVSSDRAGYDDFSEDVEIPSFDKNDFLVYWNLPREGPVEEVVISINNDNYNEVAVAYALFRVRSTPKKKMKTKMYTKSDSPSTT